MKQRIEVIIVIIVISLLIVTSICLHKNKSACSTLEMVENLRANYSNEESFTLGDDLICFEQSNNTDLITN